MSHETVTLATNDQALRDRVVAAAQKEALNNPTLKDTWFGEQVRQAPLIAANAFIWPVAIDYESEYEYAINSENPNPGGDPGVISDGNITAAVVANWPMNMPTA